MKAAMLQSKIILHVLGRESIDVIILIGLKECLAFALGQDISGQIRNGVGRTISAESSFFGYDASLPPGLVAVVVRYRACRDSIHHSIASTQVETC